MGKEMGGRFKALELELREVIENFLDKGFDGETIQEAVTNILAEKEDK